MSPKELTEEQKTKLKSCKDSAEMMSMLSTMGIELTDEQLNAVAGGQAWYSCEHLDPCAYEI